MKIAYIKHIKIRMITFAILGIFLSLLGLRFLSEKYSITIDAHTKLPIYCTDSENMDAAITINCAWGAKDIPQILDILDENNAKATFFVLGVWAEQNPEMLKLIYERGHEIGNHSYSHKLPSQSTIKQLEEEIDKCNNVIYNLLGFYPQLYRAPSGDYTQQIVDMAENKGMYSIKWSVDSIDWKDNMSSSEIINRVTGRIHPGGIILFHNDTQHILEVLPAIITHLKAEGYDLVTVSDMIYKENFAIDREGMQYEI